MGLDPMPFDSAVDHVIESLVGVYGEAVREPLRPHVERMIATLDKSSEIMLAALEAMCHKVIFSEAAKNN